MIKYNQEELFQLHFAVKYRDDKLRDVVDWFMLHCVKEDFTVSLRIIRECDIFITKHLNEELKTKNNAI